VLRVTTLPAGLFVLVDGEPAGRSPLLVRRPGPGQVRVRVLREDPRQFDRSRDEALVSVATGDTAHVAFDLRPPVVLETRPPGAGAFLRRPGTTDRPVGRTPLPLLRAEMTDGHYLLRHSCCADTVLAGAALLEAAAARGTAVVALRPTPRAAGEPRARAPVWRRRWVHWGLVGIGAGLTGASVLWKRRGDAWYDRYLESSDRMALEGYYDRAILYDRRSLAALAAGQALFTVGIVLLASDGAR